MQKSGVRSRFSETNGCRLEMRDVAPRNNWELSSVLGGTEQHSGAGNFRHVP